MICFRQGKTINIEVDVINTLGVPVTLTEAEAVFAYLIEDGDEDDTVVVDCTILGSTISVSLDAADTALLLGTYDFEIKLKDSVGDIDSLVVGKLEVLESIIATYPV